MFCVPRTCTEFPQIFRYYHPSSQVLVGSGAVSEQDGTSNSAEFISGCEQFAAGLELIHLFMLVQDDAMDSATTRRGVPSVNAALQRLAAIPADLSLASHGAMVVGDILHVKGVQLMATAFPAPSDVAPRGLAAMESILESE